MYPTNQPASRADLALPTEPVTGGALLQKMDRDTQKCAFKCCDLAAAVHHHHWYTPNLTWTIGAQPSMLPFRTAVLWPVLVKHLLEVKLLSMASHVQFSRIPLPIQAPAGAVPLVAACFEGTSAAKFEACFAELVRCSFRE